MQINNNKVYGCFLSIDYDVFLKKGNKLEPGHVVYFKNSIAYSDAKAIATDPKRNKRSYLITHIDGYKMTLLPLTTRIRDFKYTFKKELYPNVGKDRQVLPNIVNEYTYNVEKVYDKISEQDFDIALSKAFKYIYLYSKDKDSSNFLRQYIGTPNRNDIIRITEKRLNSTNKYDFVNYFIIESNGKKGYKAIEINPDTNEIIGMPKHLDFDIIPFSIKNIDKEVIRSIRYQLIFMKPCEENPDNSDIGIIKGNNFIEAYDIAVFRKGNKTKYGLILATSATRYAICYIDPQTHEILSNAIILSDDIKPDGLYKISDEDVEIYKNRLSKTLIDTQNVLKNKKK